MNVRVLLFALLSSAVVAPGAGAAEQPARHEHKEGDHEHTELGEHMEKMGGAFRRLGRQISDASRNEDSLKLVEVLRTNAQAAAKLEPEKAKDIPAGQRDRFVEEYREGMKDLLGKLEALAATLNAGQNAGAAAQLKELKAHMEESHKQFRKKKDS